jgi:hypothetical protein
MPYLLAADAVLFLHVVFVVFVVVGLILILTGKLLSWAWVHNWWFRVIHLTAIGIVVLQSWLGVLCPLTKLEMLLRDKAGEATYAGSFVSHWLETILYYRAPAWVFAACYTAFAVIVVLSWVWVRPHERR